MSIPGSFQDQGTEACKFSFSSTNIVGNALFFVVVVGFAL